ncbi:tRNA (N6-isopentenyl adenosine(37)-C2)-methylthiotransferase MiaB [Tissierella sp. Yu-01]|uniref:tRNA (N6-isopentenyl adenosine(37)-C2)-methylthiotransferase MiaB n=1 Tax=Tissierella sp. Yu-01 TaxID=3035694 RepID=UPI00240D85F8|nr:tRNA (N6-isopentenyl adenosine(37)-C2)-methylthiotransferase MiaB [Tissierella sp. Yu-01]WFA09728.1 tRNA (N6-isopentenyl adenosine(37)-C2)-methylthiotransferase MiaB [Tissierella sp. Yu-01]
MKKYMIQTYGCQMNEHDSEKISWILDGMGYELTDNREECDLIIFNTCAVRKSAEERVFGQLGELKSLKRINPNLILSVCGCMMQREDIREVVLKKYKHVDVIFGTNNIHKLPQLITRHLESGKTIVDINEENREIEEDIDANRKYSYKAFVNIMYGCNNFCTYCIVPYTRGRERSREPEKIIEEITLLAKNGCKEVTLLGQNVNSYGKSLEKKYTFSDLLKEVNEIEGIERIRFMTSHPKDISDDLIDCFRTLDKLCDQLHLPVQSGSNRMLKAMNRKYTREDYINKIEKIRKINPDIAITTDIIVGFPGETDEDFQDTLDLVKEVKYDSAFTFLYSIREGTKAATMEDQVPEKVKHERFQLLLDTLYPIGLEKNERLLRKNVQVLVEEVSKNNDNILNGRTTSGKLVHFPGSTDLIGKIVNVKIDAVKTFTMEGTIVES